MIYDWNKEDILNGSNASCHFGRWMFITSTTTLNLAVRLTSVEVTPLLATNAVTRSWLRDLCGIIYYINVLYTILNLIDSFNVDFLQCMSV